MAIITGKVIQEHLDVGMGSTTAPRPGGGTVNGFQVGVHTFAVGKQKVTSTWDPPPIANGGQALTTVAYAGASLGDFVDVSFSLDLQGLQLRGYVSSANVVTVTLSNITGAGLDLASGTISVLVFKSR